MTIVGIIVCSTLSLIFFLIALYITVMVWENSPLGGVISGILGIALIVGIWLIGVWYFNHTEAGKRAIKTQNSDFNGGILREVKVYDAIGNEIANYQGKFDVEYDDGHILFDDENGNRHIIYYKTGTVIIDEIGE